MMPTSCAPCEPPCSALPNNTSRRAKTAKLRERLASLTPREREVMDHVVAGQLNKQIAGVLGTGEHTIKVHRGRVMQKMGVESLADLVRVAERLGVGKAVISQQ